MSLTRRRVLGITAAVLVTGPAEAFGMEHRRFRALGAECVLTLPGDAARANRAVLEVRREIARIEAAFSLWSRTSELSRLNRDGVLARPSSLFLALSRRAAEISRQTESTFDVTMQARWQALASGADAEAIPTGWRDLEVTPAAARFLRPGMAATFNGIAQGFAADRAVQVLHALGYRDVLANLGEFASLGSRPDGEPWRLGVADPNVGGIAAELSLPRTGMAVATSAPQGTLIQGHSHIFDPLDRSGPRWSSVTVMADDPATADALSTAVAAAPVADAQDLLRGSKVHRAVLIALDGGVTRWPG